MNFDIVIALCGNTIAIIMAIAQAAKTIADAIDRAASKKAEDN